VYDHGQKNMGEDVSKRENSGISWRRGERENENRRPSSSKGSTKRGGKTRSLTLKKGGVHSKTLGVSAKPKKKEKKKKNAATNDLMRGGS